MDEFSVMLSAREGGWKNGQEMDVTVHQRTIVRIACAKVSAKKVVYNLEVAQGCTVSTPSDHPLVPFDAALDHITVVERYHSSQCPASFKRCFDIVSKEHGGRASTQAISIKNDGAIKVDKKAVISVAFYFPAETASYWHLERGSKENHWHLIRTLDEATKKALKVPRGIWNQGWGEDCIIRVVSASGWSEARVGFPWPSWGEVVGGD